MLDPLENLGNSFASHFLPPSRSSRQLPILTANNTPPFLQKVLIGFPAPPIPRTARPGARLTNATPARSVGEKIEEELILVNLTLGGDEIAAEVSKGEDVDVWMVAGEDLGVYGTEIVLDGSVGVFCVLYLALGRFWGGVAFSVVGDGGIVASNMEEGRFRVIGTEHAPRHPEMQTVLQ